MPAKVTLHAQGPTGWFGDFLGLSGASHFKGVSFYPTFQNVIVIGRPYYEQSDVDQRVREGADGAEIMFNAVKDEVLDNPQVDIWETPANEPSIWLPSVAEGFIAFTWRMIELFRDIGKDLIVGSINTG